MAAHTYWRLYIGAKQNLYAQMGTVSFLNAAQVNQSTGGTATASSEYDGLWAAGKAFDGDPGTEWASTTVSSSEWIAYQHPSPVDIVFVGVKVSTSYPVSGLALQYSDDGVSWSDASPLYLLAGQPALTSGSYTVLGLSASRRPLVLVDGRTQELPDGDTLPPQAPAAHTHPATSITNTPAGGIAATNVQAAINELDSEKANAASVREKLTAARTYYVRTDGSDSNSGLANTAGGAFLTIQKAVDVASALDNGGFDITLRVVAGTYTTGFRLRSFVGSGLLRIRGDTADSTSTVISVTSGSCVISEAPTVGNYRLEYMKLQTATSGYGIVLYGGANYVEFSNLNFGACASPQIYVGDGSLVNATTASYTISGGSLAHIEVCEGGLFKANFASLTLTGTPAFATFAKADRTGVVLICSATFTGGASGSRYTTDTAGGIFVNGAGASYLPGSTSGVATSPGWYA